MGYRTASVRELLNATERMDGAYVEIEGEALAPALRADSDHMWVNIRAEGEVIGVYLTNRQAEAITTYGAYGVQGDTVTVRAHYNLTCATHAGELDVHARKVTVTQEGYAWSIPVPTRRLEGSVVLGAAGVVLFIVCRLVRGGRRPGRQVL